MAADRIPRTSEFAGVSAIGVLAVGVLLWIADGWSLNSTREDLYPWQVKFALLCAAFAIQVLARDRPALGFGLIVGLVLWDLPFGPSVTLWIAFSDVIYLATALGSRRLANIVLWTSLALTVSAAVTATVYGGVKGGVYATLVMLAVTWSPIGYARAVRAYRRLANVERAQSETRRAAALAEERRRLARELHDTVAGHLSAVAILADAAQRTPDNPAVLQSIRSGSLAALEEMRATINLLTSPDDAAVRTTLASLDPLIEVAEAAGGSVTVRGPGEDQLPVAVEATATRILGEAIANATKHAPGAPLEIALTIDGAEVIVTATNALPVGVATGSGNGLQNMAFRAESVGGVASAGPVGTQWVVRARIPMRVGAP